MRTIEGKLRDSDIWEPIKGTIGNDPGVDNLSEIEMQMNGHGFQTRYIGPNRRLLAVINPLTDNVECMYRSVEAIAKAEGR